MKTRTILAAALLTTFAMTAVLPGTALAEKTTAQKRQQHKNDWRNLAGAGAAVAGYGLLKGNKTATVLGAAGAAYSAKRYEDERKHQDAAKRARARYHRSGGDYVRHGHKYYRYRGHMYSMDLNTGERRRLD